jgi:hypothetical protein
MLRLKEGEYDWEYNLHEMTQCWVGPGGDRHCKPVYRKEKKEIVQ